MKLRLAALLSLAVVAGGMAATQARAAETVPMPSAQVRCLTRAAGKEAPLSYPADMLRGRHGGTVRVEMSFESADAGPRIELPMSQTVSPELVDAVRGYVADYRMPCLEAGKGPVRLRQEFVFTPNDGRKVVWTTPQEEGAGPPIASCWTHVEPNSQPAWPLQMRHRSGKVLVRMEFTAADQPPTARLLADDPYEDFGASVLRWVAGIRVPCLARPFTAIQLYSFRAEGARQVALRDVPLVKFLRGTRDVSRVPVYFDFQAMGCPFEVRLKYWQPHAANGVGEIGASMPSRRPFLDWLAGLSLDLKPDLQNLVLGDELTIAVPCGTLDL